MHRLFGWWIDGEPFLAPPRSEWPVALRRARVAGIALLLVELVALCVWSVILARRYSLTLDFSTFQQGVYLIAHGDLNPLNTDTGILFWHDHVALLFWPLAVLQWVSGSPETLLWLQDGFVVAALIVSFLWLCDIVAARTADRESSLLGVALVVAGAVLLVANPWIAQACSSDVHTETFTAVFAVLAARDLHRGRTPWAATLFGMATGDVGASLLGTVGVSAILCRRSALRSGGVVAALGLGWFAVLLATHVVHGDALRQFAAIAGPSATHPPVTAGRIAAGAISHPGRVTAAVWADRLNTWAYASPAGVVGAFWPPVLIPNLLQLAETQLGSVTGLFSAPGFQGVLLGVLAPVGTVAIFAQAAKHIRGVTTRLVLRGLIVLVILNALGWGIVWLPGLPGRWLRATPSAARTLGDVQAMMRPQDEVVMENGEIGSFSSRRYVYFIPASGVIHAPVRASRVWIVLTPTQGIEGAPSAAIDSDISQLYHRPHMRVVADANGVFAVEWTPPPGARQLSIVPSGGGALAVTAAGVRGATIQSGPPSDWYVASTAQPGYVIDGDYWQEPAGRYRADVRLSVSGQADLEVWDSQTSTLLARHVLPETNGTQTFSLPFTLNRTGHTTPYDGFGPWRDTNIVDVGTPLEIRVFSPGGSNEVAVYSVNLVSDD